MSDENADVRLALEEMRFGMDKVFSAGESIDQKVNALLAAAGLLLTVVVTLQASFSSNRPPSYWVILCVVVAVYIASVGSVLVVSKPQSYHLAISSMWEELDRCLLGKSERDGMLTLLSGYVDQIQFNEAVNRRKAIYHGISLVAFALIMVGLVVLVSTK